MINPAQFFTIWQRLCRRYSREIDHNEAMDYLAYLERAGLNDDTVARAAEAVWATREFFPRPADFLQPEASAGWTAIREFAEQWTPHLSADDARILTGAINPRAKKAMEALGGYDVVRKARDFIKLRKEYFESFERVVMEESVAIPTERRLSAGVIRLQPSEPGKPGRIDVALLKEMAKEHEPLAEPGASA